MYGEIKPNQLPTMHGTGRKQTDVLRDKLFVIVHEVLEFKLDWLKDEIVEETCDYIVDSIIGRLVELRIAISEVEEDANECENAESDFGMRQGTVRRLSTASEGHTGCHRIQTANNILYPASTRHRL